MFVLNTTFRNKEYKLDCYLLEHPSQKKHGYEFSTTHEVQEYNEIFELLPISTLNFNGETTSKLSGNILNKDQGWIYKFRDLLPIKIRIAYAEDISIEIIWRCKSLLKRKKIYRSIDDPWKI